MLPVRAVEGLEVVVIAMAAENVVMRLATAAAEYTIPEAIGLATPAAALYFVLTGCGCMYLKVA